MRTGINRQTTVPKRTVSKAAEATTAASRRLADRFDGDIEGDVHSVREWLLGAHAGRPYALRPGAFWSMRAQAALALLASGQKPTRSRIAKELGINVRTLYNYEHRREVASPRVRIRIPGQNFRLAPPIGSPEPEAEG